MENNNQNTFWEKLMYHKHALSVSFFSAILISAFILFAVYNTDGRLFQGYLKKLSLPSGSGNTEVLFEHLHVFNTAGGQVTMPFYLGNVSTQYGGIELKFENWPSYLNFSGVNKGTSVSDWSFLGGSDLTSTFNSANPSVFIYTTGTPNLQNGKFLDLSFTVETGSVVNMSEVKIKAIFTTGSQTYETNQGFFIVAPKSTVTLSHPTTIQPTSAIEIPFTIGGISATGKLYGGGLVLDNIPSYMIFQSVGKSGTITQDWNVEVNSTEANRVKLVFMDSSLSGVSQGGTLFTLKFSIPAGSSVTIPATPISVQPEFAVNQTNLYGEKTYIQVGGTNSTMADVCKRDGAGNIVRQVGADGLVGLSDLHCMITEWAKTGPTLATNIYKVPPSELTVDIRDLTVLLSQYSKEPEIQSITPQNGPVTTDITITGNDFYATLPSSAVQVYLVEKNNQNTKHLLTEKSRTNTTMVVNVPTSVPKKEYKVQVVVGQELSVTKTGFEVR